MSGSPPRSPGKHIGRPYRSIESQPLDVHDATYVEREADEELWRVIETGGWPSSRHPGGWGRPACC